STETSMLASAPAIAFVPSTDLDRSRRFYADRLGLPVIEGSPFACVLRAGPTMLAGTKVDERRGPPVTGFGWAVTDIHATVAALAAAGIDCLRYPGMDQDSAGVWQTPAGDQIAWFRDPDGNTLSLTRFAGPVV